jgi:hypothetical protein
MLALAVGKQHTKQGFTQIAPRQGSPLRIWWCALTFLLIGTSGWM